MDQSLDLTPVAWRIAIPDFFLIRRVRTEAPRRCREQAAKFQALCAEDLAQSAPPPLRRKRENAA